MTKTDKVHIILARVEMTALRPTGRLVLRDLNWFNEFEPAPEPITVNWLNAGDDADVAKAKAFAATEGYTVFTYPTNDKGARDKSTKAIMSSFNMRAEAIS